MMDNIREKLVGLLTGCGICFHCWPSGIHEEQEKRRIADHLLANGVTVQEWIPVTERLPEPWTPVLIYRPDMVSKMLVTEHGGYCDEDDDGWQRYGKDLYNNPVITHWMPLPTPPKGE